MVATLGIAATGPAQCVVEHPRLEIFAKVLTCLRQLRRIRVRLARRIALARCGTPTARKWRANSLRLSCDTQERYTDQIHRQSLLHGTLDELVDLVPIAFSGWPGIHNSAVSEFIPVGDDINYLRRRA